MNDSKVNPEFSIGSVVRTTGISATTLRNWERRYGFPTPERSNGGQRLYSSEVVDLLLAVADAIERGLKPSEILRDPVRFFQSNSPVLKVLPGGASRVVPNSKESLGFPESWRKAIIALDGQAFERSLERVFLLTDFVHVLDVQVTAMLRWVGNQWEQGLLQPYHEHFVSEQMRYALARRWSGSRSSDGPPVICCTLPGEQHDLGSHMVAAVLASLGCQPVVLGRSLPVASVVEAASRTSAAAVAISVVNPENLDTVPRDLQILRHRLGRGCSLLVGGRSVVEVEGTEMFSSLLELANWVRQHLETMEGPR
jgi:MerR family transcriptional regulator, light-induced transcriptional regulator